MPKALKPRPLGRYSLPAVIAEIEEQLRRRGRGARKSLAAALGFGAPSAITKRQNDDEAHWNLEELGRVADEWDAPPGWPFIAWDEADEREKLWQKHRKGRRTS